jgi:hypothetical protein
MNADFNSSFLTRFPGGAGATIPESLNSAVPQSRNSAVSSVVLLFFLAIVPVSQVIYSRRNAGDEHL